MARRSPRALTALVALSSVALLTAGCGDDEGAVGAGAEAPLVVVTTSILGDVVENLVGDSATVEVIMPPGADPHDFAPSAQQAETMRDADVLVTNGYNFEEGMLDVIDSAEGDGVDVYAAGDAIEPIGFGEEGHDHEGEEGHEGADPHWVTDAGRMATAAQGLAEHLNRIEGLDGDVITANAEDYLAELEDLDAEITDTLAPIREEDRVLITNHEVFGYFADAYDFEVAGAVIPGGTTLAEPSAAELGELSALIEDEGVEAIFAETSSPNRLADALASEADVEVEVLELFSESLGEGGSEGETYLDMMRTNAGRVAEGLGA